MLKTKKLNRTLALCLCLVMMFSITAFAADTSNELLPLSVVEFFCRSGLRNFQNCKNGIDTGCFAGIAIWSEFVNR